MYRNLNTKPHFTLTQCQYNFLCASHCTVSKFYPKMLEIYLFFLPLVNFSAFFNLFFIFYFPQLLFQLSVLLYLSHTPFTVLQWVCFQNWSSGWAVPLLWRGQNPTLPIDSVACSAQSWGQPKYCFHFPPGTRDHSVKRRTSYVCIFYCQEKPWEMLTKYTQWAPNSRMLVEGVLWIVKHTPQHKILLRKRLSSPIKGKDKRRISMLLD